MKLMSAGIVRGLFALLLLACLAGAEARAQNRSVNVISARAGGVNFVAGDVSVRRDGQDEWQPLTTSDDLKSGDAVRTGAGARVEVLLNPGSYLRAGENSEFVLADDSLDNLRVRLTRGTALVEASGFDGLYVSLDVTTPQTDVKIVRSGVYRLNVLPTNVTEVVVEKGRALVGREKTQVRGGWLVRVGGAGLDVAKFDKKQRDELDLWGRERAKMLAEANRKLPRDSVNTLLANADWASIFGLQRDSFDADLASRGLRLSGVWYFDPGRRCYTFIPGNFGWSSPYGYGYGNSIYWGEPRNLCMGCGLNGTQVLVGGGATNGGSGSANVGGGAGGSGNVGGGSTAGGGSNPGPGPSVRPEPAPAPREFSRPSFEQPRSVEGPRSAPAMPTRDQ